MKRTDLLKILEIVKPGIAGNTKIESMSYFFFSGKEVVSYNDKISIQHKLKTDFKMFVKANDLYSLVSRLKSDELKMKEEKGKLLIKTESTKASFSTISDDEVESRVKNVSKSLKKAKWEKLPDDFCNSISLCSFAAEKEQKNTLGCVYVTDKNCMASDNKRVAFAKMSEKVEDMFILATEIKSLINTAPVKYAITKSWLHFKNKEGCVFSIRKVTGEFPDFLQFFDFKGTVVDLPKEIIDGIDIASIIISDIEPMITVNIKNKVLLINVKSESGKITHKTKVDYDGEEVQFSINPSFLKEMMTYSSKITIADDKMKLETSNFSLLTSLYV